MDSGRLYRLFEAYKRNGMDPRRGDCGKLYGFEITIKGAVNVDWDERHRYEIEMAGEHAIEEDEAGIVRVCTVMEMRNNDISWGYRVYRGTIDMYGAENDIANGTVVHTGDSDVIGVLHDLNKLVTCEIAEYGGRVVQAFFENCNEGFEANDVVYDLDEEKQTNVNNHIASFIRVTKSLATARSELHDAPKHAPRLPELPDTVIDTIVNSMTGM